MNHNAVVQRETLVDFFLDLVAIDGQGRVSTFKTPSTPHDYGEGIIAGLSALLGARAGDVADVLHATTVGSNTVLEGKGARLVVLLTDCCNLRSDGRRMVAMAPAPPEPPAAPPPPRRLRSDCASSSLPNRRSR